MAGYQAGLTGCSSDEVQPVAVPPSVLCNRDSMLYYAEQAYLTNAPKALFFTAAGYYAKRDGLYPDTLYIPTVDQSTAEEFLYLSASQDYPPALRLIRVLSAQGDWTLPLPEQCK